MGKVGRLQTASPAAARLWYIHVDAIRLDRVFVGVNSEQHPVLGGGMLAVGVAEASWGT